MSIPYDTARCAGVQYDGDWREAENAVDAIAAKFGRTLVRPATLLGDDPDRRMPMRGDPT